MAWLHISGYGFIKQKTRPTCGNEHSTGQKDAVEAGFLLKTITGFYYRLPAVLPIVPRKIKYNTETAMVTTRITNNVNIQGF
jgi:hypothetical protein